MTMHLARGLTTINTKKQKQKKLTKADQQRLYTEWRQYNKRMRRNHMHDAQFDCFEDYIAYTHGRYHFKTQQRQFKEYQPRSSYKRSSNNHIPSLSSNAGVAAKKESQQYTGDLLEGIATMHKSNAVPVMKGTNEAKDISRMRRG